MIALDDTTDDKETKQVINSENIKHEIEKESDEKNMT